MTDKYKNIPPDIREDIAALGDALIALPAEEKQIIRQCIEQGGTPPPTLAGLLEATRAAMEQPEAQSAIDAALKAPRTLIYTPGENAPDVKGMEDFARMQLTVFSLLEREAKARIAAAIRDKDSRDELKPADRYIWGTLWAILTFPGDYTARIAEVFKITPAEAEALKAEALKAKAIEIPVEDETGYLPGLEPTEAERAASTPAVLFNAGKYHMGERYRLPVSKFAQYAHQIAVDGQTTEITVAPRHKSKSETMITVTLGTPTGVTTARKLEVYDNLVEAAIGNILDDNPEQPVFTAASVYKRMRGNKNAKPTAVALAKVEQSIVKLATTWTDIDFSDQLKLNGDSREGHLRGMLLQVTGVELKPSANATGYKGWRINYPPLIYAYSKMVKQISTVDSTLLDVAAINNTPEAMTAQFYLLQQIERMKKNPATSRKITYDALFETTGDTLPLEKTGSGRKARTMRLKAIRAILDAFIAKGYIAGYTETQKDRKKDGVNIHLPTAGAITGGGKK
ncbi:MAG: hypothetical protein PHD67_09290 [Oscillospiraceae bacterium]|nr:hypothetical protein [Oscillospiraceae bacterium]